MVALFLMVVTVALGYLAMKARQHLSEQPEIRMAILVSFIVMVVISVLYLLRTMRGVLNVA